MSLLFEIFLSHCTAGVHQKKRQTRHVKAQILAKANSASRTCKNALKRKTLKVA